MHNHEPENYECPLCLIAQGIEKLGISRQADIVRQDNLIVVMVNLLRWPNNQGSVIIFPKKHIENIYDIPDDLLVEICRWSKKVAMAMKKVYGCDGVSVRQHNEPEGDQDVWHYHYHVVPRYIEDRLYQRHDEKVVEGEAERADYAKRLREYFGAWK